MRVCLITAGQPSNNPRLVKEADVLAATGHEVHVICTDSGLWPTEMDRKYVPTKQWSCEYVGGRPNGQPLLHRWTRIRYALARRLADASPAIAPLMRNMCSSRAAPEIAAAVMRRPADLYIAHHATLLPAAVRAAKAHQARVGYDAEDFYSGMSPLKDAPSPEDLRIEKIERRWLPECNYMTAAAPAIADEYVTKFAIERPITVLNAFPRDDRPSKFRPTTPKGSLRVYWFSQVIGANRGLEDIVRAMGLLKGLKIELHLRGSWQRGYCDQLFSLAAATGVGHQIHRHAPASPVELVRSAAEFDVGLAIEQITSRNAELCLSNKIFTYLLAGTAFIATRTPGQLQFLSNLGLASATYECGDFNAMAAALKRWYVDRSSLDTARRSAWDWGQRRYNWDIEKQYFLQAVESACGAELAERSF